MVSTILSVGVSRINLYTLILELSLTTGVDWRQPLADPGLQLCQTRPTSWIASLYSCSRTYAEQDQFVGLLTVGIRVRISFGRDIRAKLSAAQSALKGAILALLGTVLVLWRLSRSQGLRSSYPDTLKQMSEINKFACIAW